MKTQLIATDYSVFRNLLSQFGSQRIKSKGCATILYDHKNRILAKMEAPSIDNKGRCHPARYYINGELQGFLTA